MLGNQSDATAVPAQALACWKSLRASVVGLHGRYRHTRSITIKGEPKPPKDEVLEFGTSDGGAFIAFERNGREVAVSNPDYAFHVERAGHGPAYELTQFHSHDAARQLDAHIRDYFEPFLFAGFEIVGKTMPDFVASDRFTLLSLSVNAEQQTATIEFTYDRLDRPDDTNCTGGSVTFDTRSKWAIVSYDCRLGKHGRGRIQGEITYRKHAGRIVPHRCETRTMSGKEHEILMVEVYEMQDVATFTEVSGQFRLEHYGLSVPATDLPDNCPSACPSD